MTPAERSSGATNLDLILTAITEVKTMLTDLDGRVRALEQATITQSVTASQKLEAAFSKIDSHALLISTLRSDLECRVKERIEVTDKIILRLTNVEGVVGFVKWVGGAIGLMIAVLLWKIFTGEVVIK